MNTLLRFYYHHKESIILFLASVLFFFAGMMASGISSDPFTASLLNSQEGVQEETVQKLFQEQLGDLSYFREWEIVPLNEKEVYVSFFATKKNGSSLHFYEYIVKNMNEIISLERNTL